MDIFHSHHVSERDFDSILSALRSGGVIGFPTDTVYGLGADPFNPAAIERIFRLKERPETKPILLLADSVAMVETIAEPNDAFYAVAEHFWPGPLTIILTAKPNVPGIVTAHTGKIGVRWPKAAFATALVSRMGIPITATSANRSGMPSPITCGEVREQLGDSLAVLVDGGVSRSRQGSTILDLSDGTPVLVREGPVTLASLQTFFQRNIRVEQK